MMRALVWREWREIRDTAAWWTAAVVFLAVTLRVVDEVVGISVVGCLLAISLGAAATTPERSHGLREFLWTRPVRRATLLAAKLVATHGFLTLVLLLLFACSLLDLPGRVYGLIADRAAGGRVLTTDAPAFYPFALLFPNLLLALVMLLQLAARSRVAGVVAGIVAAIAAGVGIGGTLSARADWFTEVAVAGAVAAAVLLAVLLVATYRFYRTSEVAGGAE